MIYTEDEFALENRLGCIIPFSFHYYFASGMKMYCFERLREMAERFCRTFQEEDAFTPEAFEWLDSALTPYLAEWEYERDASRLYRWRWAYELKPGEQPDCSKLLPTTRRWEKGFAKLYDNMTTMDIDFLEQQGRVMYATIIDGRVVSYAAENSFVSDDFREIGVETVPEFRGRGYAQSNTAALARDIVQRGLDATYNCTYTNKASLHVAESVGFRAIAKSYAYPAFLKS